MAERVPKHHLITDMLLPVEEHQPELGTDRDPVVIWIFITLISSFLNLKHFISKKLRILKCMESSATLERKLKQMSNRP